MLNEKEILFKYIKLSVSCNSGYLSENLSTNNTTEGQDVTITCDVLHSKDDKNAAKWSKDGLPVKFTDRVYNVHKEKQYTLEIKKANKYDSGNYSIDVDGRKRSLHLEIKPKYNIPLEIQKMTDSEKDKYIKILQEGNEKRYHIKIMILGRQGVGKSSLMRRLLRESIKDVISTDGIDIVRRCKVDIESKDWIFFQVESTGDENERIGRALRQTDKSESLDHPKTNNDAHAQNGQNTANPSSDIQTEGVKNMNERKGQPLKQENKADKKESHGLTDALEDNQVKQPPDHIPKDEDKEGSTHLRSDFFKAYGIHKDSKQDTNNSDESLLVTKKDDNTEMAVNDKEDKSNKQENEKQKVTEIVKPENTENIETLFEIGCKTTVSGGVFADCIIMDFAGHEEYYSTHQTFLTTNAIYMVVFKFDDDNPFADTVEETEQLGFWIDNIHCYAQTGQDAKDGGANTPIIMLCTRDDAPDDQSKLPAANMYNNLIVKRAIPPVVKFTKWEDELRSNIEDWKKYFFVDYSVDYYYELIHQKFHHYDHQHEGGGGSGVSSRNSVL
ncbi:unnamed protein product [Mytilus coruscus]|uniref:Ig-like domain-containing protein n=1 Tax=Mytilus coruscus TaxID=42192 RepID=A0A6J8C1V6_MYTCO|nr:unnamed protein product [Mytilus coruscus]